MSDRELNKCCSEEVSVVLAAWVTWTKTSSAPLKHHLWLRNLIKRGFLSNLMRLKGEKNTLSDFKN